jgi:hypothetical protein
VYVCIEKCRSDEKVEVEVESAGGRYEWVYAVEETRVFALSDDIRQNIVVSNARSMLGMIGQKIVFEQGDADKNAHSWWRS